MEAPKWILVQYERGTAIYSGTSPGLSISDFSKVMALTTASIPSARIFPGISHHLNESDSGELKLGKCIAVVASPSEGEKWIEEINDRNKALGMSREDQWWQGTDVGLSSSAIFAFFSQHQATSPLSGLRNVYSNTPADSGDFGRCLRLLALFPEWKPRLGELAAAHSAWKPIVEAWDELEAMPPNAQTEKLRSFSVRSPDLK